MAVGDHVRRHRQRWRSAELAAQAFLIALLAAMLVFATIMVLRGDVTKCDKATAGSQAGWGLAVLALAGFVAGRGLGYLRKLIHEAPAIVPSRTRPNGAVQGFLLLFLGGTTGLLIYETIAVYQFGHPPAITTYVRCAAAAGGWTSAVGTCLVGLLLGNWLWYPTEETPWRGYVKWHRS